MTKCCELFVNHCCPIKIKIIAGSIDFKGVFGEDSFFEKPDSPQRDGGHREEKNLAEGG